MSSPITINYSASRAYERSSPSSSPSSPGLYVPIHRRFRVSQSDSETLTTGLLGTSSSYASASRSVSPAPSSTRSISPVSHTSMGHHSLPIYTPADLILLSTSPLAKISPEMKDALRTAAPEVVQTRKQRKAQEWRALNRPQAGGSHQRMSSHSSSLSSLSSESEGERAASWRRV